jgi:hypothetical protein
MLFVSTLAPFIVREQIIQRGGRIFQEILTTKAANAQGILAGELNKDKQS